MTRPARIYDLRSTFGSNALASGVAPFELARIMGTSVAMIKRNYGALIGGAGERIAVPVWTHSSTFGPRAAQRGGEG